MKHVIVVLIGMVSLLAASPSMSVLKGQDTPSLIRIVLDDDVIEDAKVGSYTHTPLVQCAPALEGISYFSSRSTIEWIPKSLRAGTTYRCGGALFGDALSTFSTESFRVIEARRIGNDVIRIEFNDAVEAQTVSKHIRLFKRERMARVPVAFDVEAENNVAVIRLKEQARALELRVESAMHSRYDAPVASETIRQFDGDKMPYKLHPKKTTMQIYDAPRFVALKDGKLGIRFFFKDYDTYRSLRAHLVIDGIDNPRIGDSEYLGYYSRRHNGLSGKSNYYADVEADFEPGKRYKVTLKKGLQSYNHQLRRNENFMVTIGNRNPSVRFDSDKPYISSLGEIGIKSVNTDKLTVVAEKLLSQNYRYFLTLAEADTSALGNMGREVLSQTFDVGGEHNAFIRHKLSLKSFVKTWGSGIYRLSLHYGNHQRVDKVVYFSDIGIAAKLGDDQLFVSASKLSDAAALADAGVTLYSSRNEVIAQGKTDENGICIIEHKNLKDSEAFAVEVVSGNERNFLVLNRTLNYVPYKQNLPHQQYRANVYMQSKLVRPGEDATMLISIRDKAFVAPKALPFKVIVRDPNYTTIYKQTQTTNAVGAFDLSLHLPSDCRTGRYGVKVLLGERTIGSGAFNVETFMPQKIRNHITLTNDRVKDGGILEATLGSDYLFGAPAAGLKAQARLSAVSTNYSHPEYPGYRFVNERLASDNAIVYLEQRKEFTLDSTGNHDAIFPIKIRQRPPSILRAQLGLTVFDDGRPVSKYASVDILPFPSMVGVKVLDAHIEHGEEAHIHTTVLDPMNGTEQNRTLDVVIERFRWHYHYGNNGRWVWHKSYEPVTHFQTSSGQTIRRQMLNSGDYLITVSEPIGGHSTSVQLHVSGWDYNPISPTSDFGANDVVFEDKPYKVGDILHADVRSPITKGRMLVTLETDRVLWHRIINIDKGSASVDIPIEVDLKRGAYLFTSVVRSTRDEAELIPYRAKSFHAVRSDRSVHKLTPIINAAEISGSQRNFPIDVQTVPNSHVVVSVVDQGILQILGQLPPKLFDYFNVKAPQRIEYYDLYDQVMHYLTKGIMLAFGGGDAAMLGKAKKHLTPDMDAKRVKPFVYWSGMRQADANGTVHVNVPIGQFNGEAQIVAISMLHDAVGAVHKDVKVRDDIMIKPQWPRFAHVGDIIRVPVRVFNTTDTVIDVNLSATATANVSLFDLPPHLSIAPQSSTMTALTMLAGDIGKAEMNVTAAFGDDKLLHRTELPLFWSYPLTTIVKRGETDTTHTVTIPSEYFTHGAPKLYVTLSDSLLGAFKDKVDSLIGYPYGCAEQTSSKLLAMANIDPFIASGDPRYKAALQSDRNRFINEGIAKLQTLQHYSGEFAYWKGGGYVNAFASVYASDVLLALKSKGYGVSDAMLSKVFKSLKRLARGSGTQFDGSTNHYIRLYAAYLLATSNRLDRSIANALYDQKRYQHNIVTLYMMAAILHRTQANAARDDVLGQIERYDLHALSHHRDYGGHFYSRPRALAFALYVHLKNFSKNSLSKRLHEALAESMDHIYSTQDKAFTLRALVAYYGNRALNGVNARVMIDGKSHAFDKPSTIEVDPKDPNVTIVSMGGTLHFSVEASQYLPKPVKTDTVPNATLHVTRTYVNDQGAPIDLQHIKLGDLIYSKITLTSRKKVDNIAVVDRIAACFDIVNERTDRMQRLPAVQDNNFRPDHQDIRDDRVVTFIGLRRNQQVTYYTPLRISSSGSCQLPALIAEAMYDPRINDYVKETPSVQVVSY